MAAELREVSVKELSEKLKAGEKITVLDVREVWELSYARLTDERVLNLPMSEISKTLKEAFPPELRFPTAEIVVMCHHGARSANVALWMLQNGWENITSLAGGIDAYATQIDHQVGTY